MSRTLNSTTLLTSQSSFVIKDDDCTFFKFLTYAGFQSEVRRSMQAQQAIQSKSATPCVIDASSALETIVFLDYVSASATLQINLPDGEYVGQKVNVSINVLSGTPLTTIVIKDTEDNTLYTLGASTTLGFIVDQDLVWKQL